MDEPWLGDDASHISVVMSPFSQLISQISLFFVHILFCLRLVAPSRSPLYYVPLLALDQFNYQFVPAACAQLAHYKTMIFYSFAIIKLQNTRHFPPQN